MKKFYSLLIALASVLTANAQWSQSADAQLRSFADELPHKDIRTIKPLSQQKTLRKVATRAAQNRTLSYCDGEFDNALGFNIQDGDSCVVAIRFSKEQLASYVGGKIKSIRYPFYNLDSSLDIAGKVSKLYGWIAQDDINNTVVQKRSLFARGGWNTITLSEPFLVDGEHDLYIGVSVLSKAQTYVVTCNNSVAGSPDSFLANNGFSGDELEEWEDCSEYGAAAIEAVIEGVEVAERDAVLSQLSLNAWYVSLERPMNVDFVVKNNGSEPIKSFDIEAYINDNKVATQSFAANNLALDEKQAFGMSLETGLKESTKDVKLTLRLVNLNGAGDDANMANNSGSLQFSAFKRLFAKNVLVEEGTGTWCGYCPAGYVGMEKMAEEHPDDFVGVAVHYGDAMDFVVDEEEISTYTDYLGFESFPSSVIDHYYSDVYPSYEMLAAYYDHIVPLQSVGKVEAAAYWADATHITVKGSVTFCFDEEPEAQYSLLTFLLEDEVGPYVQSNYFAGGGQGPMGGFESKGQQVPLTFNDVLRGVYPGPLGELLEEPQKNGVVAYKAIPFEFTYEITPNVHERAVNATQTAYILGSQKPRYQNKENLRLAVVLLSESALNATKVKIAADASAISNITGNGRSITAYYDLNGTRLSAPARKGIYVEKQGEKVVKRLAK